MAGLLWGVLHWVMRVFSVLGDVILLVGLLLLSLLFFLVLLLSTLWMKWTGHPVEAEEDAPDYRFTYQDAINRFYRRTVRWKSAAVRKRPVVTDVKPKKITRPKH